MPALSVAIANWLLCHIDICPQTSKHNNSSSTHSIENEIKQVVVRFKRETGVFFRLRQHYGLTADQDQYRVLTQSICYKMRLPPSELLILLICPKFVALI